MTFGLRAQEDLPDSSSASEESTPIPEANATAEGLTSTTPVVSTWDFVRMAVILGVVVGAIYLLFFLLRKGAGSKILENDLVRVLGSKSLGANRMIHLVQIGTVVLVVGSADASVSLIAQISDRETLDAIHLEAERNPTTRRTFAETINDLFSSGTERTGNVDATLQFMKRQQERLKRMQ